MMLVFTCHNCGARYERPSAAAAKGTRFCSGPCRVAVISEQRRRPLAVRFWEKVDVRGGDECWPWMGKAVSRGGYGAINLDGKILRAPRVSYELANGPIGNPKIHVRHKCDNPPCVNPAHLILGGPIDNMADKVERGRQGRNIKVTDQQVQEIREAEASHAELAVRYGVSIGLVNAIRSKIGHRVSRKVTLSKRKEKALSKT